MKSKTKMAAESGGGSLVKVLGEYGIFIVEMGSLEDVYGSINSMTRIKLTCISTGRKFIAIGTTSGGVYIYNRKTLEYVRLISTKEGAITRLCFALEKNYLGVATSNGIVLVIDIGSRTRDKPKCLRKSEEHKNSTIICFCWDDNDRRLFAGSDKGFVSVTYLPIKFGSSVNVPKKRLVAHKSAIIGKSDTAINQMDYAAEKLLISTMTKTAVLDLATSQCWLVGSKPREGVFGACFLKQMNQESATIYTARPGSRLWEASLDGQVISTQHYKQLFAVPPSPVLGFKRDAEIPQSHDKENLKSFNFAKLLLIRERFLLTWLGSTVYLLDPVLGQLAGWYQLGKDISDVCCHGNHFYIYHLDGHMTWYGVLTVKETVARLFEINEVQQCIKVTLECKSYLIPGSARDWVPVSLVTSLIKSVQEQPDSQELVESLQQLEQQLEENTNMFTDRPPGFYGDRNMIDSPETMSINSDICSHHMDSGLEDDDDLSVNHGEGDGANGLQNYKEEFSLENALLSVAAKAKKFAEDRQKSNKLKMPTFKKMLSVESITKSSNTPVDITVERGHDEGTSTGEMNEKADSSASELSLSYPRRTASFGVSGSDTVADLSDENGMKCEDDVWDSSTRKDNEKAKDKKKKKRRVITVDINSPSNKTQDTQPVDIKVRSESYSSYEVTKMEFRRSQFETVVPRALRFSSSMEEVPSQLPPAIPAMLSKAKVLIKKKLTVEDTGVYNPVGPALSQSLSGDNEGERIEEDDDTVELLRPVQVDKLESVTITTREEVRTSKILYNRKALRHVLQQWIPFLYPALDSCKHSSSSSQSPGLCLVNWLGETCYADACMLTQMCLDTGVYGETERESCDHKECSRDSNNLESAGKENVGIEGRPCDQKQCSRDYTETELEKSGCHGVASDDVMIPDQEIVSRDDSASINLRDLDRSHDSSESPRDYPEVIKSESQTRDFKDENMEDSKKRPRNTDGQEHGISNSLVLNNEKEVRSHDKQYCEREAEWTCDSCLRASDSVFNHDVMIQLSQASREKDVEKEKDCSRASFIRRYFVLLRVKDIRRTLSMTTGYKHASWSALLDCIKIRDSSKQGDVSNHIEDGHVTRALHVLHDGIREYQDSILHHLANLYELNGRETLMTCVRMYPDVLPWEVMEICHHGMTRVPQTSAQCFVYYVEQLLRWGVDAIDRRLEKVENLCEDKEFMTTWFHHSLIASNPDGQVHCLCGLPKSGSHRLLWKYEDHLQRIMDVVCQRRSFGDMAVFLDLCWRHGYWSGVLRLYAAKGHRYPVIQVIVSLGDMDLLEPDKPWGPTPQSMEEWKTLLELVAAKTSQQHEKRECACADSKGSVWSPDIIWENVVLLALKRLGASRLMPLLQDVPYQELFLPVDFYYKCIMGIVIEKEQNNLIHQMLTKLDSYFWSKRAGILTPEMNYQRIQEQESKQSQVDPVSSVNSLSRIKTLEDAATHWGVNIHLADAVCPVCTLQLGSQVSSSNQGLLVFECGHVYHRFCVPERACVVCFHQNLKTLGKRSTADEENTVN